MRDGSERSPAYRMVRALAAALVLATLLGSAPAPAQQPTLPDDAPIVGEIVVATRVLPPFVMTDKGGGLTGFSVDLWRAMAAETGLRSRFQVYDTLPELLASVTFNQSQAGIAAISITAEREQTMEFSQPMYRSGLQIMVPAGENGVLDMVRSVFSLRLLLAIGVLLLALLVPAHVAWAIHRFHPESTWKVSRSYVPGILQAFYWSGEKMIGTAIGSPGGSLGRAFNNVWSFLCVMVLASLTALIASALTVSSLRTDINGPEDLAGKRVATVSGSTSAAYLRDVGASVVEFPDFAAAVAGLGAPGSASRPAPVALVYDAPIIQYSINNDSERKFVAIGSPFRAENYGIAFPLDSKIRHRVDAALLKIRENGTFDQIREKWFGKSPSDN